MCCCCFDNRKKSKQCPATLIRKLTQSDGYNDEYTYKLNNDHSHLIDARDAHVKERMAKIRKQARETTKPPRQIIAESLENTHETVMVQMPTYASLSKTVRRERKDVNQKKAPKSLDEIDLGDVLTANNEPFLFYDSGTTDGIFIELPGNPHGWNIRNCP